MGVTGAYKNDAVQLKNVLASLPIDDLETVAADSAYLSWHNCDLIEAKGAKPFIKPKRNVKDRSRGSKAWKNMIHYFRGNPQGWRRTYRLRSSAETAFSAIKRKFGHRLTAVRKDLQRKELMTKVIVYNLNIVAKTSL